MAAAALHSELHTHVGRWLRWARLRAAVVWCVRGILAGLAVGLGLAVVARLQPVWDAQQLLRYVVAAALAGAFVAGPAAYLWPRSRLGTARAFDRALGLSERTSTALELARQPARAPAFFVQLQLDDALHAARRVHVRRQLPLHFARNELLIGVVMLALVTAGVVLPNDQLQVLAEQRALEEAIVEQAAALEEIRANVIEDESLTDAQREELLAPLDAGIERLQSGDLSREEAVAVLVETEQGLRQLVDPAALREQSQGLQPAGAGLGESELTSATGERMVENDYAGAAEGLRQIDPASLSAAERQELAEQLQSAAEELDDTSPAIAAQFEQAAEALESGDAAGAQEALEGAAEQFDQLAAQQAQAEAAQQAAGQVQQAQQTLAGSDQASAGQPGASGESAQSAGQGQEGGTDVQGSTDEQSSQGAGSSGSGRGESDSASGGGQAGAQPIGENAPGDAGTREFEAIYAPERLGGQGGPEVQLEGSGDPGDEITAERPTTPEEGAGATVPYDEVYSTYSDEAHRAVESGQVPVGLRAVVRQYFENLEPNQ